MIKKSSPKLKLNKNKITQVNNNKSDGSTIRITYHATRNAITLIALVITIIVLLVLAGVTLMLTIGQGGLLEKSDVSVSRYNKEEATEAMNLKITNIQIKSYTETQKLPNLQYLADNLCEDNEMEYVIKKEKQVASLEKIDVSNVDSIFTKIKKYPYEFEINSNLQLASIDGVKIADIQDDNNFEELKTIVEQMQSKLVELEETKNKVNQLNAEIESLKQKDISLETSIRNINTLTFTQLGSTTSTTAKNIILSESLENFKYIVVARKATISGNCIISGIVPTSYFKSMGAYLVVHDNDSRVAAAKYVNDTTCSMYITGSGITSIIYGVK